MLRFLTRYAGKYGGEAAFEHDDVRILVDAFNQAWQSVEKSGVVPDPATAREVIAKRIIKVATSGERDPRRLRDDAVLFYAESFLKRDQRKEGGAARA